MIITIIFFLRINRYTYKQNCSKSIEFLGIPVPFVCALRYSPGSIKHSIRWSNLQNLIRFAIVMIEICCSMVNHSIMNVDDNNRIQNEFLRKNNIIFFSTMLFSEKEKKIKDKIGRCFCVRNKCESFYGTYMGQKKGQNHETRKPGKEKYTPIIGWRSDHLDQSNRFDFSFLNVRLIDRWFYCMFSVSVPYFKQVIIYLSYVFY